MRAHSPYWCLAIFCSLSFFASCDRAELPSEPGAEMTALNKVVYTLSETGDPHYALAYLDSAASTMKLTAPDRLFYYFQKYNLYQGFLHDNLLARSYADSAVQLFTSGQIASKKELLFRAYMHRANANYTAEFYEKAFEDYAVAREIAVSGGSPCTEFMYVYRIAMVYFREENYLASARLFVESYKLSETCSEITDDIIFRQQEILSNIGLAYSHTERGDSAYYYFRSALQFIDRVAKPGERKWDEARAVIYGNIGTHYALANRVDSARMYFEKSLALGDGIERNIRDRQFTAIKLADVLIRESDLVRAGKILAHYDSVDKFLRERRNEDDNIEFDLRRAGVAVAYYEAVNDLSAAMKMMRIYDTLKQRKHRLTNRIIKNDLKSGVDRKDYERYIVSLEKDVRIKRLENVILVLSLVIAACIAAIIYDYLKKHRKKYSTLERKSRKDELNFIALIENTDDFLWSVDERFHLLAFNKAYKDYYSLLTGAQPVVGGAEPLKYFNPEHYAGITKGYAAALAGNPTELTGKGLAADGSAPDVRVRFRPIRTPDGVVVGVSCFRSDITEYLQLISTLEKNNERLRDIAWVQSHKLRDPLTTIMSIVAYLRDDDGDPEMRASVLESLREKLKEMDDIIHEIVSLTKD